MNKNKFMKERIAPLFIPHGFTMKRYSHVGVTDWEFVKRDGDLIIWIVFSNTFDISVRFSSTNHRSDLELRTFLEKKGYPRKWWKFDNDQEWFACMEEIEQFIVEYGPELIERISRTQQGACARVESHRYIQAHYSELVKQAERKWELKGKTCLEQIDILFRAIKNEQQKSFQEAEPMLIVIAAYMGKVWIDNYNGEWVWNDDVKTYVVKRKDNHRLLSNPLLSVVQAWKFNCEDVRKMELYNMNIYGIS